MGIISAGVLHALQRFTRNRTPRLVLRRSDGKLYLRRWGWLGRWGGVFLHHIPSGDPGKDLHDHPWPFVAIPLHGGYVELRHGVYSAGLRAKWAERSEPEYLKILRRGHPQQVGHGGKLWNVVTTRHAHRILHVLPDTWTLVLVGPRRRDREGRRSRWGFYIPSERTGVRADGEWHGWVDEHTYDEEFRPSRELYAEGRVDA